MRHENVLNAERAALVVVDLQEAFRPAIHEFEKIVARTAIVIEAAKLLGVPILATEQAPAKLGATVEEIRRALPPNIKLMDKSAFSSCGADGFMAALKTMQRPQIMLVGIESHVCMNQTAHDLLHAGFQVHLLTDCTSSRTPANRALGIDKMLRSGALPSSSEMALFELIGDAQHEHFRMISRMIK
jgi:nicotinamidase-related amidase